MKLQFYKWFSAGWSFCNEKEGPTLLTCEQSLQAIIQTQGATTMAMQYASAYYVAQPSVEILVFIDEAPSDLPEGASLIIETKSDAELLKAVEPYFILGSS